MVTIWRDISWGPDFWSRCLLRNSNWRLPFIYFSRGLIVIDSVVSASNSVLANSWLESDSWFFNNCSVWSTMAGIGNSLSSCGHVSVWEYFSDGVCLSVAGVGLSHGG
jgi:hypothetical protein